jgi:hypothetical protein
MTTFTDLEEWVAGHALEPARLQMHPHVSPCQAELAASYRDTILLAKWVFERECATAKAPEDLVQTILASLAAASRSCQ